MSLLVLLRESWATALAAKTFSAIFAIVMVAVVTGILVLAGQVGAQRQEVQQTFARPDLRTVTLTDDQDLGLIPASLAYQARLLSTVESAWGLGTAFDVYNGAFPEAGRVSGRAVAGSWGQVPITMRDGRIPAGPGEAVVEVDDARSLRISSLGGVVEDAAGRQWAVVGTFSSDYSGAPSHVLVFSDAETVHSLVVTCVALADTSATARILAALSESTKPGQIVVGRSDDAEELRASISTTVNRFGQTFVLITLAAGSVVLAFLSFLMVHSRRQEFGRRRALGATRAGIIGLVMTQGLLVFSAGALVGLVLSLVIVHWRFGTLLPFDLIWAVPVCAVVGAVLAQVPSAITASLRDPVQVLRTP